MDFEVTYHGSLILLAALTTEADNWCEQHLPADRLIMAGSVVVEPRYIDNIVTGITSDGLTVA